MTPDSVLMVWAAVGVVVVACSVLMILGLTYERMIPGTNSEQATR